MKCIPHARPMISISADRCSQYNIHVYYYLWYPVDPIMCCISCCDCRAVLLLSFWHNFMYRARAYSCGIISVVFELLCSANANGAFSIFVHCQVPGTSGHDDTIDMDIVLWLLVFSIFHHLNFWFAILSIAHVICGVGVGWWSQSIEALFTHGLFAIREMIYPACA